MPDTGIEIVHGEAIAALARQHCGNPGLHLLPGNLGLKARLSTTELGDCRMTHVQAPAHVVDSRRVLRNAAECEAIKLILQVSGESRIEQDGVGTPLAAGNWLVFDPSRPYMVRHLTTIEQIVVHVPRHRFAKATLQGLARPRVMCRSDSGAARIAARLAQSVCEDVAHLDVAQRRQIGSMLVGLGNSLMVRAEVADDDRLSLAILRDRVRAYVERNIARPTLTIDEIAERMGCSRRTIFLAFQAVEQTPSRLIWDMRLDLARARLDAPAFAAASVAEIAYSCGFASSAHFSRAYRRQFGVAPSAHRRLH